MPVRGRDAWDEGKGVEEADMTSRVLLIRLLD